MAETIMVSTALLETHLDEHGHLYLDDDRNHVDEMPDRGWYVSLDGDEPIALRLSDSEEDAKKHEESLVHRTDVVP